MYDQIYKRIASNLIYSAPESVARDEERGLWQDTSPVFLSGFCKAKKSGDL